MARVCEVTGKGPMVGNNVSHANNKTTRRWCSLAPWRPAVTSRRMSSSIK